jgi:menaquinone-dependent protoporphyrinogen oxidase
MKTVLIAYLTQTGSTKEAASIIAEVLDSRGFKTTVAEIAMAEPGNFDIVVIGSPIHGMRWAPEAADFLRKNRETLSRKKIALFSVAYVYFTGRPSWKKSVDNALAAIYGNATPIQTGVFPGRVDRKLPGIARLIFGIAKSAKADIFDRKAIDTWANDLANNLAATENPNK